MGKDHILRSVAKRALPKRMVNKIIALRHLIRQKLHAYVPFDNMYPWLNYAFLQVMRDPDCATRPQYVWGVVQGTALAKVLGISRISVIEFGVAGGSGLIALECIAQAVSKLTGIDIDVCGFDTGTGLPPPADVRDQPNMWYGGQLPMDKQKLLSRLNRAKLYLGPVKNTLKTFINEDPAPVAFASFDMDLYTSTRDSFEVFDADYKHLLPRVISYFDDIFGHTYNDFCGERLAISEFNSRNGSKKMCPVYGLRYFIPRTQFSALWPDGMYYTHIFDHKFYNSLDSINKPVLAEIDGTVVTKRPPSSSAPASAPRS